MMSKSNGEVVVKLAFSILAVVGLSAFAGVMLAVALVLGPIWRGMPPAQFLDWFGANSGLIARTIPVVAGPSAIGLIGAIALSRDDRVALLLWIGALGGLAGIFVLTFVYFLPLNAAFLDGSVGAGDVGERLYEWLAVHWVRVALALVASGLAVAAVARHRA